MKRSLLTGVLICSVSLACGMTSPAESITWVYSEENMEKTYQGSWTDSSAGFQFYLPTEGWEEYDPDSEHADETESEYPEAAGTETEAETPAGAETEAETAAGAETEAERSANAETETETAAGAGTEDGPETESGTASGNDLQAGKEAETEMQADAPDEPGISEFCLVQPEDGIIMRLYHLESEDGAYPGMEDIFDMFGSASNVYYTECNGIKSVHFDADHTENLAFPEIAGDKESGFTGSVAILSIRCDDREERELFADEIFSSVRLNPDDPTVYLNNGLIWSEDFDLWTVQNAADRYVRMLSHKKFVSSLEEDEPVSAEAFALMDLDEDGLMELLVRYEGTNPSMNEPVRDYALYTYSGGEEKLLLTMEGLGPDDTFFYFPGMNMLEYDVYSNDEFHYDCYEYDGSDVIHSDYYDYDWDLYGDEEYLMADDLLIANTEENREMIEEWMQESMEA